MTRGTPEQIATPVIDCGSGGSRSVGPVDVREREREAVEAEELLHHQRELVGGAVGVGRDAPVVDEIVAAEQPDDRLGVAGVDRRAACRAGSSADVETDVEHPHRVGERTHRDEVGAGLRVRADGVEGDATRHLDLRGSLRASRPPCGPRRGSCCRASTTSTPASRASATWSSVSHSTSMSAHRPARPRALDRLREPERGEVVVLDQHRGRQRVAVVEAAAGAHRRALHAAQAGQRLAGVEDAGLAARGAHVAPGQRARHPSSDTGS